MRVGIARQGEVNGAMKTRYPDSSCAATGFLEHWSIVAVVALCWWGGDGFGLAEGAENAVARPEEAAAQLESEFRETVQPVLKKHCYRCHGSKKMKSGLRVDVLDGALEDQQLFLLKHVQKQLQREAMPPEDERQPSAEERDAVLRWASRALREGERKVRPRNGSVRRLTVAQYQNTLRDLLGVEDRLADVLPADGVSKEGFRNNKDTLLLTPQMMETYFEIAGEALDLCLIDESDKPRIQCFRVELGAGINKEPVPDPLKLEGPRLLPKTEFRLHQVVPEKAFAFESHAMQTTFRFVEGYNGNATVRGWKEFEGLYHSVFAAITGTFTGGYNYGRSSHMVPEGLLLRPRSPETKNGVPPVRGPAPTFSMPMRELPKSGVLQVTVEAARYDDAWQPSARAPESAARMELDVSEGKEATLEVPNAGVYQVDVVLDGAPRDDVMTADFIPVSGEHSNRVRPRTFSKRLRGPFPPGPKGEVVIPLLVARFAEGRSELKVVNADGKNLRLAYVTPISEESEPGQQFARFEKRVPKLSVHMGVRTDVGPRLAKFDEPKPVPSAVFERYSFHAPIGDFASPDTEENNVNYLAGLQEIAIRSEPTDDRQIPRVLVRAVEIEGPFYETWPPKGHRDIFPASVLKNDPPAYAREVIKRFVGRAYRRPIRAAELESLFGLWSGSFAENGNFHGSVRDVLLVVLTSPQFLFLIEESDGPQPEPLSPYELAAKLSYFLWNTTPDERLLALAASGALRASPACEVQCSEVDRLIADKRFEQFADEFVSQWLSLDKFDVVSIHQGRFPRLDRETRRELRREPIQFVMHLIRGNLPLANLIDSEFIVANEVVADYYGIGRRTEEGFAFVPVAHGSEVLGGVLTQAAVLSGLSDGHESNPVKRGAWLARKIVAEPPEPPPPNVPDLAETDSAKTLRERLEQHRSQEGCAGCHQKIDPWGLPLEAFDAGGLFKRKEVDARSTLPDGTEISDSGALKRHLVENRLDQVAFSFLKHLASYATGRTLTFNEIEYLKNEGRRVLGPQGYPMKDCVRFLIKSPLFMEK